MKRIVFFMLSIIYVVSAFSQGRNVTTCWNCLKPESKDLVKAKEAIDPAAEHPKTMSKPDTWWYRGQTYHEISDSCQISQIPENQKKYCDLAADGMVVAYDSYLKALSLNFKDEALQKLDFMNVQEDFYKFVEVLQDPKTRYQNQQLLVDILQVRFPALAQSFAYDGFMAYKKDKDFEKAFSRYEKALVLYQFGLGTGRLKKEDYLTTVYQAAYFATQAEKPKEAVDLYKSLVKENYGADNTEKAQIYIYIANAYLKMEDSVKYLKTLDEAFEKYPDEYVVLEKKIDYYLKADKSKKAKDMILKAIEKKPDNKYLHFAIGTIFNEEKDYTKAAEYYKNAIEIDGDFFDAVLNIGGMYNNIGVDTISWANKNISYKEVDKYNAKKEIANSYFKQAQPYLEKAMQLIEVEYNKDKSNSDNKQSYIQVLKALSGLYAQLSIDDKYQEIKTKIEGLK